MFRRALYYPWIDISNEQWLKTAALYWSKIHTIVPESISNPYTSESAKIMNDAGLLEPIVVNSQMPEMKEIAPEVLSFLETDEALRLFMYEPNGQASIHPDKLAYALREELGARFDLIHSDKINYMLRNKIMKSIGDSRAGEDGWISMPTRFANYYMTLLANKISQSKGIGVVSDYSLYDQLTLRVKKRNPPPLLARCPECGFNPDSYEYKFIRRSGMCTRCGEPFRISSWNVSIGRGRGYTPEAEHIADGLLAQITLKSIGIRGNVKIDKIIEFREKHDDAFSSFRAAIQGLVNEIRSIEHIDTLEALQERMLAIHENEIKPRINELERKLNENLLDTFLSDFKISGVASMLGISSGVASFPLLGNYALLAGAGISAVATGFMCYRNRRHLEDNPYSYVLSVKNEFGY